MQFLTTLFGGEGNTIATMALALGIVLLLIVLAVWALKMIFSASGSIGRGRNRRLSIVDSLPIDPRRQLVIIRRDNVEHLLMTGGPQDMVIETGIPVEPTPIRVPVRRPPVPATAQKLPQPKIVVPAEKRTADGSAPTLPVPTPGEERRIAAEQVRDAQRPVPERRPSSLRHTGLMRPAGSEPGVITPFPENSGQPGVDSVKEGRNEPTGKGNGDVGKGTQRDQGRTTDGT